MSGTAATVLVVDDIPAAVELLERHLAGAGFQVRSAGSVEEAVALLRQVHVELVITDLRLPGESGLELVRHVREQLPDTEVMLVTGYATIGGAVEALQHGAAEYLVKPYTEEELLEAVARALARLRLRQAAVVGGTAAVAAPSGIIGESPAMQQVFALVDRAASSNATVLITGESGTGKELVARAVHYGSTRRAGAFVPVNCGAIPETLLESELFGHERGAFTGADRRRSGFFQAADHGSIFLDEISETTPATQVKLLRVLQDGEITMVGSSTARHVDVRVIAATNKSLPRLVEQGAFRADLFYRINVLAIELPPLHTRAEDVLLLAGHFAAKYCAELDRPPLRFTDAALQVLLRYRWPGNVRELQNLVQRLAVMSDRGSVDVADLPGTMKTLATGGEQRSLAQVEAEHIGAVLAGVAGNKAKAARILGIDRKTLYEKLKRYGIAAG